VLKVLVLVALLALAIYLIVRTVQGRGAAPRPRRPQRRPPPRPIAPDDDPDFLRDLDRKRKHPDDPDVV
jgi:hypothetical protein